MRAKTILIAWLFTAVALFSTAADHPSAGGAEPGGIEVPGFGAVEKSKAEGIGLSGPSTANVGQEVTIRLTGTPPVDLSEPLTSQLDWLMGSDRLFCYLAAPGQPLQPLDVRGELVFGVDGATIQPLLRIVCVGPGEVRILCDWNSGQSQLAEHMITIGGPSPSPIPDPTPEPGPDPAPDPTPPLPLSQMLVIVVEESADRTREQAWILLDPTVRKWMTDNGHRLRILDKDSQSPDALPWIQRATAPTETVPSPALPRVLISDSGGSVSFVGDLPAGPIGMLELVKKWGAEK